MGAFLDITAGDKTSLEGNSSFEDESSNLSNFNKKNQSMILDDIKKAFLSSQEKENIFAQNSGLNIFVSNIIDDKQDVIDNLSKVIDEKFVELDSRLYKVDEIIEKFARCKVENERLKTKVNQLRDENYLLKDEVGNYSKIGLGFFFKSKKK